MAISYDEYGWPIDNNRKFESKYFTLEELTEKQQENSWLRNRDAEDGIYTEYPTDDYCYTAYECLSIDELKAAFLYGNWAIRQCFTYKNLAFINQINAGDEWWTLKKFEDGILLSFESITMIAVINHETKNWTKDYRGPSDGSGFHVVSEWDAKEEAEKMTLEFHEKKPEYANKKARYIVGDPQDTSNDFGIYFVDIATDYFPEYIEQLLTATHQQCCILEYTSEEFNKKWNREP